MIQSCPSCGADLLANEQSCAYCGHTQLVTSSVIATPEQRIWVSPQTQEQREICVSKERATNDKPSHPISKTTMPISPLVKGLFLTTICFIILGSLGIGITYYFLNRPQPVISISSEYQVGDTLAGATGTVFHINGSKFSNSSVITLLLDGIPTLSNSTIFSDAHGNINANLIVTENWPVGPHVLTARDEGNNTTQEGISIMIVPPGQAQTPGPNGAPPDDASFRVQIMSFQAEESDSAPSLTRTIYLIVTGESATANSKVCSSYDNQEHKETYNMGSDEESMTSDFTTCSGTYKSGEISYTQTLQNWEITILDLTCTLQQPTSNFILQGNFIDKTTIKGTGQLYAKELPCDSKNSTLNSTLKSPALTFIWTGILI